MAHSPLYRVPFRRRRQGKTDYRRRLGLLKSRQTRVVVRTTSRNVIVQFVEYDETGDKILAQAQALELSKFEFQGGANTPSAYLAGFLAATRAKEAGIEGAVFDLGRAYPHKGGVVFSALKGIVDGGVEVPHGEDIFPSDERIRGAHINDEKAAAFAAAYEKLAGKPYPEPEEKPKKGKGGSGQKKAKST